MALFVVIGSDTTSPFVLGSLRLWAGSSLFPHTSWKWIVGFISSKYLNSGDSVAIYTHIRNAMIHSETVEVKHALISCKIQNQNTYRIMKSNFLSYFYIIVFFIIVSYCSCLPLITSLLIIQIKDDNRKTVYGKIWKVILIYCFFQCKGSEKIYFLEYEF